MSDDLIAFLRARLDEDEIEVRALLSEQLRQHQYEQEHPDLYPGGASYRLLPKAVTERFVLVEIDAKRQIIKQVCDVVWAGYAVRDVILELLALPYADHPDYRQEWRP